MTYRTRSFLAAIGLAVVAAMLVGFYVSSVRHDVTTAHQHVEVYVAARDIPEGTSGADVVSKNFLKKQDVLRQSVVPGAISSPEQVQQLVAAQETYAGEQVSLARFSNESIQGIRGVLRGPLRAVQIAGDPNQTLAGTLRVGDRVDVVANVKVGGAQSSRAVDRIVLRNLRVLKAPEATAGGGISSAGSGSSAVMLAVTDTQVQKLFFVVENDQWMLALRPVVKASDSPETVETQLTIVDDGLSPSQLLIARGG
jgi:Flp pilus assembly protein CpaB